MQAAATKPPAVNASWAVACICAPIPFALPVADWASAWLAMRIGTDKVPSAVTARCLYPARWVTRRVSRAALGVLVRERFMVKGSVKEGGMSLGGVFGQ
ncbi:hypothetical protein GLUCOINTEAF2_0203960 [Komagataeibacter intermedius AF2]|uniref:Uncharacterized protein n=1 Tax=Komagataeibacter intermedius AF2 TaxID=1458464 RepID=A0A0N0MFY0_9PROT|nr:hypothetical protein GLUCOINTEAF2_0203960 [Komagataeibacter intermedius AF2]